jgi:transcriptional regulator with XRE-family HTH domain
VAQKYRTLADYFEQTGKSKRALAKRLNVSESYISHIAAGRKQPSLAIALAIAQATGVPAAALVREVAA